MSVYNSADQKVEWKNKNKASEDQKSCLMPESCCFRVFNVF